MFKKRRIDLKKEWLNTNFSKRDQKSFKRKRREILGKWCKTVLQLKTKFSTQLKFCDRFYSPPCKQAHLRGKFCWHYILGRMYFMDPFP